MLAALAGAADKLKFAVVPKAMNNPFFDIARDGCIRRAKELDADAPGSAREAYIGTNNKDPGRALGEMLVKAQPRAGRGLCDGLGRPGRGESQRAPRRVREAVGAAGWKEVSGSPLSATMIRVAALVGQRPFEIGEKSIDTLLALHDGAPVQQVIYTGVDRVTKDSVAEFLK
jgi:ABC-type sugar transport system substrate-binding protein